MNFIARQARHTDLASLVELTKQFTLLNLPSNPSVLERIIERSEKSFAGQLPKSEAQYLFVIEDMETNRVVASSMIIAKHGTDKEPHFCFQIVAKEHFSKDIGIGFKHNVLRFKENKDGPTEIGGLLVDKAYRTRPEKIGRLISLVRFVYMSHAPENFEEEVLCELSPPLTPEGRSEFWEALGRRFTGLPYAEADQISQTNKEFITSLFPREDIYISLLEAKARLDVGRIAEATEPAKHMLEKIGFHYLNEVDPFDGGPHYGAKLKEIRVVQNTRVLQLAFDETDKFEGQAIVAAITESGFVATTSAYAIQEDKVSLPAHTKKLLQIVEGQEVYLCPID
tara:strand:- start:7292 stop:8308 length:1017 start_codon:yes stop_codon:yes gene_type:complete